MKRNNIFNRLSIQHRLPLLICFFLLSAITVYGFANYYSLKKATLAIGKVRLTALSGQLSSMFGQSASVVIKSTHNSAIQKYVIECVRSGGKTFQKETVAELNKLHRDSTWVAIQLLDSNKKLIFHSNKTTADVKVDPKEVIAFMHIGPDSALVGKIYNVNGAMYYPVVATVTENKHIMGYIFGWQILKITPQAVAQFTHLLGNGVVIYIENSDASMWTNLLKPLPDPAFKVGHMNDIIEYEGRNNEMVIASAKPVPFTDWVAVVEFPQQTILEGVKSFTNLIIISGLLLTVAGVIAAWIMSRNITRPLNHLTHATTTIAEGNYSALPEEIKITSGDEVGKLAYAFNVMAKQVFETQQGLEEKVKERTEALSEEIKLRKLSEEYLRESRKRYHMLVDEVKDYAIIMLDAEGKILVWNQGAQRIQGYMEKEILGKPHLLFYTQEDINKNKPQQLLEKAAKEGRSEDEGWRLRKDGSKFWADVVFTSIYNDENRLVGFTKITRDISDRKQLEEDRGIISAKLEERVKEVSWRTLQLEMVNKELEAFSYSVSHDLRTPLRAINGYSIMLKEDYEEKLDAEGKRIMGNIIANAKMMGQLIDDLLAFSRLGKRELTRTRIDMQLLATNVINELLQNDLQKDYRINIDPLPPVEGDPVMIKQVLMNLLTNAIKYSSKEAIPEIEIGSTEEETRTIYYVKDNGVGFDMAYADKLFGVFQRLHSQEEFEGTGVGLALVKRIIDKHNGEVWAEAEENTGATFYFSLPKS